jgi:hypothetical protein
MMGMLKPLGIEKGQPFEPDARQKQLLEDAAFVGEAMAKTITFAKRFDGARTAPIPNGRMACWEPRTRSRSSTRKSMSAPRSSTKAPAHQKA